MRLIYVINVKTHSDVFAACSIAANQLQFVPVLPPTAENTLANARDIAESERFSARWVHITG